MREELMERISDMPGHVGMYYKNLKTGEVIGYKENESFGPASIIKLPILMHIYRLAQEGKLSLNEKIKCLHQDKLGGCGALCAFTDEPEVSIETLCELMITISDNSATNLLIKRIGREALNEAFLSMGLAVTKINRLLFDSEAAAKGIENEASPKEMAMLLEQIYTKSFVDAETSLKVENLLLKQQINHKIPGIIGSAALIAHKTGEDDGISNDVALVYAPEPFILCFFSNETFVPDFEVFIRETAYDFFLSCGGEL
ncbi:MAG: serine hydrolase [Clostridia bacterium]|nr:serine hydrolase [Clostridia bacterium]